MTEAGPLTRMVRVDALPREGQTVVIEASPAEREALASLYKLPAIAALTATLHVDARRTRRSAGDWRGPRRIDPDLRRVARAVSCERSTRPSTCGSRRRREEGSSRRPARETVVSLADEDDPDPVVDGRIDLGALTAEIFALGLDPYPRKPGAEFVAPADEAPPNSPFAALAARPAKR